VVVIVVARSPILEDRICNCWADNVVVISHTFAPSKGKTPNFIKSMLLQTVFKDHTQDISAAKTLKKSQEFGIRFSALLGIILLAGWMILAPEGLGMSIDLMNFWDLNTVQLCNVWYRKWRLFILTF
jgi:hypothetical protein